MIYENLVDIHSHILPGVDDGAASISESIDMLKLAIGQGIGTIYATPHYGKLNKEYDVDTIKKVFELLQKAIKQYNIDINIELGHEIYYTSDVVDDLNAGRALCLGNTKNVLIEFSTGTDFATIIAATRELMRADYLPIIAHAERYVALHNIDNVEKIRKEGARIQVNADMLTEPPAKEERNTFFSKRQKNDRISSFREAAWKLLQADVVDFIATDAHNSSYRKPIMRDALQMIEKVLGIDNKNCQYCNYC